MTECPKASGHRLIQGDMCDLQAICEDAESSCSRWPNEEVEQRYSMVSFGIPSAYRCQRDLADFQRTMPICDHGWCRHGALAARPRFWGQGQKSEGEESSGEMISEAFAGPFVLAHFRAEGWAVHSSSAVRGV